MNASYRVLVGSAVREKKNKKNPKFTHIEPDRV